MEYRRNTGPIFAVLVVAWIGLSIWSHLVENSAVAIAELPVFSYFFSTVIEPLLFALFFYMFIKKHVNIEERVVLKGREIIAQVLLILGAVFLSLMLYINVLFLFEGKEFSAFDTLCLCIWQVTRSLPQYVCGAFSALGVFSALCGGWRISFGKSK